MVSSCRQFCATRCTITALHCSGVPEQRSGGAAPRNGVRGLWNNHVTTMNGGSSVAPFKYKEGTEQGMAGA